MKGIYCYVDKKNDTVVYVGKDSRIDKNNRHKHHLHPSSYDAQPINRVLQNNPNRYTYQVLVWDVVDEDTLNALEVQYIRQLDPKFNFTEGGDGMSGYIPSEETRRKISEIAKERCKDDEWRQKQSERTRKQWEDEEYCKIMSKIRKEMWKDDEYRQKISEGMIGENNPNAKYGHLWDISSIHYHKSRMFNGGREPNPCKCFIYRYKGKDVPIGSFHDFTSVEIINNLVENALE